VRIWHGHGFKFMRKAVGRALWVPYYREALSLNIAMLDQWKDETSKPPASLLGEGWDR